MLIKIKKGRRKNTISVVLVGTKIGWHSARVAEASWQDERDTIQELCANVINDIYAKKQKSLL